MLKLKSFLVVTLFLMPGAHAQNEAPLTARDFFKLIPRSYYTFRCCNDDEEEYLRTHVTTERINFLEGNDEGFNAYTLAVYKRSDRTYLIGFHSEGERWDDYYFLEYRNGKLSNISKTAVPQYSMDNIYEYAADGKAIHVYRKKYDSATKEINVDYRASKGRKLYDLIWQKDRFVIKK